MLLGSGLDVVHGSSLEGVLCPSLVVVLDLGMELAMGPRLEGVLCPSLVVDLDLGMELAMGPRLEGVLCPGLVVDLDLGMELAMGLRLEVALGHQPGDDEEQVHQVPGSLFHAKPASSMGCSHREKLLLVFSVFPGSAWPQLGNEFKL